LSECVDEYKLEMNGCH